MLLFTCTWRFCNEHFIFLVYYEPFFFSSVYLESVLKVKIGEFVWGHFRNKLLHALALAEEMGDEDSQFLGSHHVRLTYKTMDPLNTD